MIYIDIQDVLDLHDQLIHRFGWLHGIKNKWQLESVLSHIQNDIYYPEMIDKVTHLFFCFVMFHCFNDGNKRTAIASVSYFLYINNIYIPDIWSKLEDIAVWVAKWLIQKEQLHNIFLSLFASFAISIKSL
jgi:death-on-curing protein